GAPMMGKLLRALALALTYLSLGTTLALVIAVGYLVYSGKITHDRLIKIAAIMEGRDLDAVRAQLLAEREVSQTTQLALLYEATPRARLCRDIELREQTLRTAGAQLRGD